MAIGISTRETLIASKEETTERTYAPPTLASDFFTPIEFPTVTTEREAKERTQISGDIGVQKSLAGMRSSGIEFAQEFRGSGDGGVEPEWGIHAKTVIGKVDNRTDDITVQASSTTTNIKLNNADIVKTKTLDGILVKDTTNGHAVRFITNHGDATSLTVTLNTNDKLDVDEGGGEVNLTVEAAVYSTPSDLAKAIQKALNASASLSADYTVAYAESTAKYTISRSGGNFSILWNSGVNGALGTDQHIGTSIGFDDAADDTGAGSYEADNIAYDGVTIAPALDNAPAATTVISGASTYKRVNTGHPSLSFTVYPADTLTQVLRGCKGTAMSIGSFTTGEIPQVNFTFQGLTYDNRNANSSTIVPNFQDQLPALALGADFRVDGSTKSINNFSLEIAQEVTKIMDVTDDSGAVCQRASRIEVTGTIDPWLDGVDVTDFTAFDSNTDKEILAVLGEKDSSGNFIEGSITAVFLPQTRFQSIQMEDADGILRDAIGIQAHRGNSGELDEITVSAL